MSVSVVQPSHAPANISTTPGEAEVRLVQCTSVERSACDLQEEWVTTKKVDIVTTKSVERKVQRQIVLEDGRVVEEEVTNIFQFSVNIFTETRQICPGAGGDRGHDGGHADLPDRPGRGAGGADAGSSGW